MCLTESHCGTDLGLLKTKAVKQKDNSYKLSGQKIFITSGDHDLTENIIHLVLARVPGSPSGTKGISLFLVPKFVVKDDGSIGPRNGVNTGSIETRKGLPIQHLTGWNEKSLSYLAKTLNLKIKYLNANDKSYIFAVFEV